MVLHFFIISAVFLLWLVTPISAGVQHLPFSSDENKQKECYTFLPNDSFSHDLFTVDTVSAEEKINLEKETYVNCYFTDKAIQSMYYFILHRKSNKEFLYYGIPGRVQHSKLVKEFVVKTGMAGERPTPLPQLMGKDYWLLVEKHEERENPETAPYFITLNIASPPEEPYGPSPYIECGGQQCNWVRAGYFGLHGVAGMPEKLSSSDLGSSGCIRHSDEDITYLYNLLDPKNQEIRYYIYDI